MARHRYRFGEFELHEGDSRLTRAGAEVALQPRLFDALTFLVRRPGKLLTKGELLEALWPDAPVNEEALTQTIRRLRRALDDDVAEPRFIQTVPKRGYRFLPAVELLAEPDPAAAQELTPVESAPAPAPVAPRVRALLHAALATLLCVALLLVLRLQPTPRGALAGAGQLRRVSFFPERDMDGDLSPDGRRFVFSSQHGTSGQFDLYVGQLDGSEPRRLTDTPEEELAPRFSPDGRSLVFTRTAVESFQPSLWRLELSSGQMEQLVEHGALADWSPDGRMLVFLRDLPRAGRALLRRRLSDGSERELLRLAVGGSEDTLAWSPDGRLIALASERRALVLPAEGGEPRVVAEPIQTLAWLPDSRALVCDGNWGGRSNLWRVPLDGGERTPLTSGASLHRYPAVSADGRRVLYTNEQWQWLLWSVAPDGRLLHRVGARGSYLSFSLSADGTRLVYDDLDAGPGEYPIRLLELATGEEREVARGSAPSISPDGRALAFVREEHGQPGLWIQDLEDGQAQRVFGGALATLAAAWSPDAGRLAFVASTKDSRQLLVSERSGAGLRRLAEGQLGAPAWSPDGRWLAASGSCSGSEGLLLVDASSGACRRLTPERSYESPPLWDANSRGLRVLVGERSQPRLLAFDLAGRPGPVVTFSIPAQPSFWGLFELRAARDTLVAQVQTVDADLYVLELPP